MIRLAVLSATLTLGMALSPAKSATVDPSSVSTQTPQWVCIRLHESTNGKYSPNLYQFQNTALEQTIGMRYSPGSYTRAQQDAFALKAYAYSRHVWGNGFEPWMADSKDCHLGVHVDRARG